MASSRRSRWGPTRAGEFVTDCIRRVTRRYTHVDLRVACDLTEGARRAVGDPDFCGAKRETTARGRAVRGSGPAVGFATADQAKRLDSRAVRQHRARRAQVGGGELCGHEVVHGAGSRAGRTSNERTVALQVAVVVESLRRRQASVAWTAYGVTTASSASSDRSSPRAGSSAVLRTNSWSVATRGRSPPAAWLGGRLAR